jgi:hypothetical protein
MPQLLHASATNAGIHASSHDLRSQVRSAAVRKNAFAAGANGCFAFAALALHAGEQRTAVQRYEGHVGSMRSIQADLSKLVHIKDCRGSQSLLHHIVRLLQQRAPGATPARFDRFGLFPL